MKPEDILAGLDPAQRQAAEAVRGPVAILAGAGTGKTRTITHRIAYGVHSGAYDPSRVLAVTFTRKAAGELQSRLRAMGADGVKAQTFHAQALAQLSYFWPEFVGGSAPKVLSGKIRTLNQAAESLDLRLGAETLRDVAAEIEWQKVSTLSDDAYRQALETRGVPTGLEEFELLKLMARYSEILDSRKQIDFEDVLLLLAGMLADEPRALLQVQERYRFFTVDEFQDVSPLQYGLLKLWLGERADLCVVGDASQTIYSFAGASSRYLLGFKDSFAGAREIRLESNYRSSAEIVQHANALMARGRGALNLVAMRGAKGKKPVAEWFDSERTEAAAVATQIGALLRRGRKPGEVAVLYRTNAQSQAIEEALGEVGISCRVNGGVRFFERADVKQALLLLRGQAKVADARPLFQVVSDVLRVAGWSPNPPEGQSQRERWEALNTILTLVDEQPEGTTIKDFVAELLDRARNHHEPASNAVTLSAIHSAKGLEWPVVFIIGMSEGLLPIGYAKTEEAIAEERRLAYVALTRARDELFVSGVASGAREKRAPSRFIAEAGIPFAGK